MLKKKLYMTGVMIMLAVCQICAKSNGAKYIFYFIGDGMGMGHINVAETYNRDVLKNSDPLLMLQFPVASQVRTYSASSPITDSAAAGTALSTGYKTRNGMIGMAPDTTDVYSITRNFMNAGWHVGVASTVAGNDATPASFYAHVASRNDSKIIASQAVNSGISFIGAPIFKGLSDNNNHANWEMTMQKAGGYTLVRGFEEYQSAVAAKRPEKVLMLGATHFGDQAGYTIDSIPGALTIAQLTKACLQQLYTPREPGFFMMIEAGNIDWAAHANDGGAVIKEILNFQQAIDVAYQFYLKHPDETLIVITADHDTGGLALGRGDNKNITNLNLIDYQKISKDRFADYFKNFVKKNNANPTWDEVSGYIQDNLGFWNQIPLTSEETESLKKAYNDTFVTSSALDEKTLYNDFNYFTKEVFDILNRHYGIGFTTSNHTGNPVPLYAIGVGSDLFKYHLNNTDIPRLILKAANVK